MTGPEHYKEAERLLKLADQNVSMNTVELTGERKEDIIAAAQAHATLALAAATATLPEWRMGMYTEWSETLWRGANSEEA